MPENPFLSSNPQTVLSAVGNLIEGAFTDDELTNIIKNNPNLSANELRAKFPNQLKDINNAQLENYININKNSSNNSNNRLPADANIPLFEEGNLNDNPFSPNVGEFEGAEPIPFGTDKFPNGTLFEEEEPIPFGTDKFPNGTLFEEEVNKSIDPEDVKYGGYGYDVPSNYDDDKFNSVVGSTSDEELVNWAKSKGLNGDAEYIRNMLTDSKYGKYHSMFDVEKVQGSSGESSNNREEINIEKAEAKTMDMASLAEQSVNNNISLNPTSVNQSAPNSSADGTTKDENQNIYDRYKEDLERASMIGNASDVLGIIMNIDAINKSKAAEGPEKVGKIAPEQISSLGRDVKTEILDKGQRSVSTALNRSRMLGDNSSIIPAILNNLSETEGKAINSQALLDAGLINQDQRINSSLKSRADALNTNIDFRNIANEEQFMREKNRAINTARQGAMSFSENLAGRQIDKIGKSFNADLYEDQRRMDLINTLLQL